ncbi:helix-turn-helix domain-containing protein [aff. Roholtiella sp. LEGE 12411]|uniref:helix-turn-helix domain-containing protein n=1 Tax=aff. Roholtiella sp. LEGE 12411 TaxID=1828822 RepID=UPI001882FBBE|nr:AraC family transcriptional regulator [aff. Roholtiella sp. LEGE 12411]MBE9036188.1 helix-turn-helix transcriptional regulator [aff. Roholtiella sp. LEGE 12411]
MSQDTRKNIILNVPRSPILWSHGIASDILRVEQHNQPANNSSECCLPNYLLSIHLGQPILLERTVDGQRSNDYLIEGDIMISPPYLHRQLSWDTDAKFLLLRLEPKLFTFNVDESVDADHVQIVPQLKIRDPLIQQIGLILKTELETDGLSDRLYAESMVNALAVHLLRRYSTQKQKIPAYSGGLPKYKLQQAIEYIQSHLLEDVSLVAIATEIGMSQYYFARMFKQSTGYSPYQYLIKCRIERAQELLMQGKQNIASVAMQVGFASQSQFGRHFKRITGVTPKQFSRN